MQNPAKAYVIEFGTAMAAYAVILIISVSLLNAQPHAPWRIPVALALVVPACFGLLAFVRFLRRLDELQRRIQLEAIGFAFGATAILTFAYGFLEDVGLPHLSWTLILPFMVLLWGLGLAIASWRYR
jgi:hypothetical protein